MEDLCENLSQIRKRSNDDETANLSRNRLLTETRVSCAHLLEKSSLDPIQMASILGIGMPDHAAPL